MMDKMKEMMAKKGKGRKMSDAEKESKMSVLDELGNQAGEKMKERLGKGLESVKVMSDSKKGLEMGLDKAKELLGHKPEHKSPYHNPEPSQEGEDASDDIMDSGIEEAEEAAEGEMSMDDLQRKIDELMALKEKMSK